VGLRAAIESLQELLISAGEMSHQQVDVPKVAQPAGKIAVGQQMGNRMQHHIRRRHDMQAIVQHDRAVQNCLGIRSRTSSQRQYRMVNIDHPVAFAVNQRWQLVHMVAVIAVIVRIGLDPFPPRMEQCGFDDRQIAPGHHDIQIADAASGSGRQIRRDIGGTLHQHDPSRIIGQGPAGTVRFPQGLPAREFVGLDGIAQNRAHPVRQVDIGESVGQRSDQGFGARDADQFRPLAAAQRTGACRLAQGMD